MRAYRRLYRYSNYSFEANAYLFSSFIFRPYSDINWNPLRLRHNYFIQSAGHLQKVEKASVIVRQDEQSIYALSTAPGRAAIAIIRISGPACLTVHQSLCPGRPAPRPRHATLRTLYEPAKNLVDPSVLDANALCLYFPAPNTATGEDILEFHIHGGNAVVKAVLAAIPKAVPQEGLQSIRYAEPGEFTRRAFYNDRLDLLQIEALSDTLSADTEQQRRLAVSGSTSVRSQRYESWRKKLLLARGELEALIDFSEDQHFDESPAHLSASVAEQVRQLRSQLQADIDNASRGELLRNGISIALIGAPNAGKSSLLNCIVGREAAIVSSEAGTTRDIVDVNVDIGGYSCRFGDLAGFRKGTNLPGSSHIGEIEKEGMRRARERALTADVVVAVLSAVPAERPSRTKASVEVASEILEVLKQCDVKKQKIVCVLNKVDLFASRAHVENELQNLQRHKALRDYIDHPEATVYAVSCEDAHSTASGTADPGGIQVFLDGLTQLFARMTSAPVPEDHKVASNNSAWAEPLGATERQRLLLQHCLEHLNSFLAQIQQNEIVSSVAEDQEEDSDIVLGAESLRSAADCLSKITGKSEASDVEEVLGVVFEKYLS